MEQKERDAYKQVISLLAAGKIDFEKVAINLAKECPEAFLLLDNDASVGEIDKLEVEIFKMIHDKGAVSAIKLLRERTGMTLKDSKDYVDTLRDRGLTHQPPKTSKTLRTLFGSSGEGTVNTKDTVKTKDKDTW